MNQVLSQLTPESRFDIGDNNRSCMSSFEILLYADLAKTISCDTCVYTLSLFIAYTDAVWES